MIKRPFQILMLFILSFSSCREKSTGVGSKVEEPGNKTLYTCPMHPEIIREAPGNCPICGMTLVKMESGGAAIGDDTLSFILKPANQQVLLKIPVIHPEVKSIAPEFEYQGFVNYIPQEAGSVAARVTGRIEKIFVKYNYQVVAKGQKLFEVYNPEILTEQNNLLFLLKEDAANTEMIDAARNKLGLLGLNESDLATLERTHKPFNAIPVYSSYAGFITNAQDVKESNEMGSTGNGAFAGLTFKEGAYVQKGQTILKVIDQNKLWALVSIPITDLSFIKAGNKVRIKPESDPENDFRGEISYIEPALDERKKKANARVVFDNSKYKLSIGSQLSVIIFADSVSGTWLPKDAVIDLGREKAVLLKTGIGFKVKLIVTGDGAAGMIKVISGISLTDEVAANAQYVMDSESFIREF